MRAGAIDSTGRFTLLTVTLSLVTVLTACGGSSGGNGEVDGEDDTPAPVVSATSGPLEIRLTWTGTDSVDILYSSARDCPWDNHAVCENSGTVMDAEGGEHVLTAVSDELNPDKTYFFVATNEGGMSEPVAARALPVGVTGSVEASAYADGRIYLGGRRMDGIGGVTGHAATFGTDDSSLTGGLAAVDGNVRVVIPDTEGGWYIGGSFSGVGGLERHNVARLHADGSVDRDWQAAIDPEGRVSALALEDDRLHVGGNFDHVDGFSRHQHLVALDAESGEADFNWSPKPDDRVHSLIVDDDVLYVGGRFDDIADATNDEGANLAALDLGSGRLLDDWVSAIDDEDARISSLALGDGRLFAGGEFSVGDRDDLVAVDSASGELLDEWAGRVDSEVYALVIHGERLFVGGRFSEVGDDGAANQEADNLIAFDTASGTVDFTWALAPDDDVEALAISGNRLFIGGDFRAIDGQARWRLAAANLEDATLDADWTPHTGDDVLALAATHNQVKAGGQFRVAGAISERHALAAIEASSGQPVEEFAPLLERDGASPIIRALDTAGDTLYFGGRFDSVENEARDNFAAVDASSGQLDSPWHPADCDSISAGGVGGDLTAVADRNRVYISVGCDGEDRPVAAHTDDGRTLSDFDPTAEEGSISRFRSQDGTLYMLGSFDEVDGEDRDFLAAFDANDDYALLDWNPDIEFNSFLLTDMDFAYAGRDIAGFELDGDGNEQWRVETEQTDTTGLGTGSLNAAARIGDRLFVTGTFNRVKDDNGEWQDRNRIAAVTVGSGQDGELVDDWDPALHPRDNDPGETMIGLDDGLFVAGALRGAGGGSEDGAVHGVRAGLVLLDTETGEALR